MVFVLYVLLSCVAPARVTGQSQEITRKKTNRRFKKDIDKTKHQTKLRIHNKDTNYKGDVHSGVCAGTGFNSKSKDTRSRKAYQYKLTNINLPIY